ncbi:MAG: hypothetical protein IT359_16300 [Gemmatimonadaceae bacterium]|nr:hypothetical protein [Gemmatimonadaceae bacterium]
MIPHTPLLLVGAAYTLARHAVRLHREYPELPCSLEFVWSVGSTSHLDLEIGISTWPILPLATFDDLRSMSARRLWNRLQVRAGDIMLMRNAPVAELSSAAACPREEVGVVLEVYDRMHETTEGVSECLIAIAREHEDGGMQVETCLRWCDTRERDVAIRWYATTDDIECAA